MIANFIELSVFSTPEDDLDKVHKGMLIFLPFDLEKEKISLKQTNAEGFNDRKITILETVLVKQRHINLFLKNLVSRLTPEQINLIKGQKETRVDDDLYLFIRFDKSRLIEEGELWLTDCGNCYHLKIGLAAFPRKKEIALQLVDELLEQ